MLINSFVLGGSQQRLVVQGRIGAGVVQFCWSAASGVSGNPRVLRPFACIGCLTGAEIDCGSSVAVAVLLFHMVMRWPGLHW